MAGTRHEIFTNTFAWKLCDALFCDFKYVVIFFWNALIRDDEIVHSRNEMIVESIAILGTQLQDKSCILTALHLFLTWSANQNIVNEGPGIVNRHLS